METVKKMKRKLSDDSDKKEKKERFEREVSSSYQLPYAKSMFKAGVSEPKLLIGKKRTGARWWEKGDNYNPPDPILNNPAQHVIPGGGVNKKKKKQVQDKDWREAARREFREETGIDSNQTRFFGLPKGTISQKQNFDILKSAPGSQGVSLEYEKTFPQWEGSPKDYGVVYSPVKAPDLLNMRNYFNTLYPQDDPTLNFRGSDELEALKIIDPQQAYNLMLGEHQDTEGRRTEWFSNAIKHKWPQVTRESVPTGAENSDYSSHPASFGRYLQLESPTGYDADVINPAALRQPDPATPLAHGGMVSYRNNNRLINPALIAAYIRKYYGDDL